MNDEIPDTKTKFLKILREHEAADEKEAADIVAISAFVGSQPNVFGKANPLGHITGSALVVDTQGRVLLTFHAKLQRWLQLGGHSLPTEHDPFKTALREAQEESGLEDLVLHPAFGDRPIDIDVHTIPARRGEPAHDHLDFRYVLQTQAPATIICSDESSALEWAPLDSLNNYDFDPALTRAMNKLRSTLAHE